uniref:Uncharacterized protein n=1 Tax=Setaria viridis TaxID=4556 RepID=A0A4U6VHD9_SETVI|nr:hypothetical protein SEVIR_3G257100v2 [Setaria viridis]
MCSLAPPTALCLDFGDTAGARTSLDRRRGAPEACGAMARGPVRRVGAVVSSALTHKRYGDGFDGKASVIPALGQQRLQERMRAELDAIRVLHRKAVLLSRGAAPGSKSNDGARFSAAGARSVAPMEVLTAKRRNTSPVKRVSEAAQQSTEPAMKQQQRPLVQSATPPPTKRSLAKPVDKAREKCRQEVVEMERAALPDETIYPWDLQELGIAFEYAVTRTRRQAHG